MDRRSGEDRRMVHRITFFANGGMERRNTMERRCARERRKSCVQVTRWSSVCAAPHKLPHD